VQIAAASQSLRSTQKSAPGARRDWRPTGLISLALSCAILNALAYMDTGPDRMEEKIRWIFFHSVPASFGRPAKGRKGRQRSLALPMPSNAPNGGRPHDASGIHSGIGRKPLKRERCLRQVSPGG